MKTTTLKLNAILLGSGLVTFFTPTTQAQILNGSTPYQPTTKAKINKAFPEFSWDRIPRTMLVRHGGAGYTDDQIKAMARSYDIIVLEKANGAFSGYQLTASRLKAENPKIKVLFYWNSELFFGHYGVDNLVDSRPDFFREQTVRNRKQYRRENPDFIKWWSGVAHKMMGLVPGKTSTGFNLQPSAIDGVFVDRRDVPREMLEAIYDGAPNTKFIMNNNGPDRNRIGTVDGTYREAWQNGGQPDSIAYSIALAQESGANNKLFTLRNPLKASEERIGLESSIDWTLGIHLIATGLYGYYYAAAEVDATKAQHLWLCDYFDQFLRPLGKPTSNATREGRVYTRTFEHCDVYLDIDAPDNVQHLDGQKNKVSRIMWKNNVGN